MMMEVDVAVIGGGPAGLAAAISCWEQGIKKIIILERDENLGGILQQCIHNGFGLHWFGEELTGPEYAQRFIDEVEENGIRYLINTMVMEITQDKKIYAVNPQEGLVKIKSKSIILAMGCRERTRGALRIPGIRPAGVYTAGMAQKLINMEGYMPGKEIVILGSGDIGLIMARRMTWEGAKVKMVCEIMPYSTGLARNVRQCLEDYEIPLLFSHTIVKIHGKDRIEGVTIVKVDEKRRPISSTEEFIACDTLLLSVGLIPENELSEFAKIEMDPNTRGPVVDEYRQTSVAGIFACGNVLHVHDLVDYVSQEAKIAGIGAAKYINRTREDCRKQFNIHPGKGINYVVPQRIYDSESLELYFRVSNIYRNKRIVITSENDTIYEKKVERVAPGEMERLKLNGEIFKGLENGSNLKLQLDAYGEGEGD